MAEQPLYERYKQRLDALNSLPLNFDLERRAEYTKANGWHIDDYHADLPPEPPGAPLEHGSWTIAREVLQEYRFPDPSIITGIYYPDRPLKDRVMLLRARWMLFTFWFGVRIGAVWDEERVVEGRREQVFGYCYQTLKGHLERGQMEFRVIKDLDSGAVRFAIHAFSRAVQEANPIILFGFRLFGRRIQVRFAHRCLERMQRLVQEGIASGRRDVGQEDAPKQRTVNAERVLDA